jgi:hypothetical protein
MSASLSRTPGRSVRPLDTPRLMGVALTAARNGHYVFPLWPRTKVPALHGEDHCPGTGDCAQGHRGWESRATRDPGLIRRWWRSRSFNVGIATGTSHLVVLDLDAAHGQTAPPPWSGATHGREVLARLAADAGHPFPGDTYTVRTPTGGLHLYFRAPAEPELRNTAGRIGWHIDSRGAGGFIIAAGSVRVEGLYRVVRRSPIAELPGWLIPLLSPPVLPEVPLHSDRPEGQVSDLRKQAYLDAVIGRAASAAKGTRHDTLLRAACTLGRLVGGGVLTDSEARAALYTAAAELERHGFPAREADRVINDGVGYGMRYPRQLPVA